MVNWDILFYPPEGVRHSPIDVLKAIPRSSDKALILRRLNLIKELEIADWPFWVKSIKNQYQISAGDYRVYINLDGRRLVVCHICRKVTQKALVSDLDRAKLNFNNYLESIK